MHFTIISGSHRSDAQSMKVARVVQSTLKTEMEEGAEILSLSGNPLPLWDQGIWEGDPEWQTRLEPIAEKLRASDGFVVISPEWHGQAPAGLKNLFLLFGSQEFGHKPALIVTVSAGEGGAYPVAELRMSSYKNNRICYLPEHVIVRRVESVLNDDPDDNDESADRYLRGRIHWSLNILREYAIALRQVRESGVTHTEIYKNGM